jgi:hypothetical protein
MSDLTGLSSEATAAMTGWLHRQILDDRTQAEAELVHKGGEHSVEDAARRWSGKHRGLLPEFDRALDKIAVCDSHIAILEEHAVPEGGPLRCRSCLDQRTDYFEEWAPVPFPCRTVRLVAMAYKQREGWQPAWAA